MDNRLIFLYHRFHVISNGGTQKDRPAGDWLYRFKPVGGIPRQIRESITLRGDEEAARP